MQIARKGSDQAKKSISSEWKKSRGVLSAVERGMVEEGVDGRGRKTKIKVGR